MDQNCRIFFGTKHILITLFHCDWNVTFWRCLIGWVKAIGPELRKSYQKLDLQFFFDKVHDAYYENPNNTIRQLEVIYQSIIKLLQNHPHSNEAEGLLEETFEERSPCSEKQWMATVVWFGLRITKPYPLLLTEKHTKPKPFRNFYFLNFKKLLFQAATAPEEMTEVQVPHPHLHSLLLHPIEYLQRTNL